MARLSQPLLPALMGGFFSCLLMSRSHSATLDFFSKEIVPRVAADSVCPQKEVSSGSSYVAILNWNYLVLKSFDGVGLLFLKLYH